LRNLDDMDRIQDWIVQNSAKKAVVCGAGFIGVEMAEQLKHRGMEVALVEGLPQIMAPLDAEMAAQLQVELEKNGVEVLTNAGIAGFEASSTGALGSDVVLQDGRRLPADVVILGLGVRPDTALAKVPPSTAFRPHGARLRRWRRRGGAGRRRGWSSTRGGPL
jgi:NADPH-dependent 2,4-dienoyl-CoA reductase/sulfur reductase-like enzyme